MHNSYVYSKLKKNIKIKKIKIKIKIAVCNTECKNGGKCVAPNVCECGSNWAGEQCQYREGSFELITCFRGPLCTDKIFTNKFTRSYCCLILNATSYNDGNTCTICNNRNG